MIENDVIFNCGPTSLSGTLLLPDGAAAAPVAVLVPGSGHHDRDETVCGHRPFRTIADHLVKQGIGTLRFDSRGVGGSSGSTEEVDFVSKVSDIKAAHAFLSSHTKVDHTRIALIGHSEGSLVAAAASYQCDCPVVMLAGPALPMVELLHAQALIVSRSAGASLEQIAHERNMNEHVFAALLSNDNPADEVRGIIATALRSWPDVEWQSVDQISETAETMAGIVLAEDYRSLLRVDSPGILSALDVPVLAIFGALDSQVEAVPNRKAFEAATMGKPNVRADTLERHNHLLQVARTGLIEEYETLGQAPSDLALSHISAWLGRHLIERNAALS